MMVSKNYMDSTEINFDLLPSNKWRIVDFNLNIKNRLIDVGSEKYHIFDLLNKVLKEPDTIDNGMEIVLSYRKDKLYEHLEKNLKNDYPFIFDKRFLLTTIEDIYNFKHFINGMYRNYVGSYTPLLFNAISKKIHTLVLIIDV